MGHHCTSFHVYYRLKTVKEKQNTTEAGFRIDLCTFRLSGLTSYELKSMPEFITFISNSLNLLFRIDIGCQILWPLFSNNGLFRI